MSPASLCRSDHALQYSPDWTLVLCVAEDDLGLPVFLLLLPECYWDYRHTPHPVYAVMEPRVSCLQGKYSTN